jgi:hypothetical protein
MWSQLRVGQIGTGAKTSNASDPTNKSARPHLAASETGAADCNCDAFKFY